MNEFPLCPELKKDAAEQAQYLMDKFKEKMLGICEEILRDIYCDVAMYIESDSWTNFRNEVIQGFSKYGNRKLQGEYDFAKIRQTIFEEHREEIIKEVEQDIVKENESLKEDVKRLRERLRDQ